MTKLRQIPRILSTAATVAFALLFICPVFAHNQGCPQSAETESVSQRSELPKRKKSKSKRKKTSNKTKKNTKKVYLITRDSFGPFRLGMNIDDIPQSISGLYDYTKRCTATDAETGKEFTEVECFKRGEGVSRISLEYRNNIVTRISSWYHRFSTKEGVNGNTEEFDLTKIPGIEPVSIGEKSYNLYRLNGVTICVWDGRVCNIFIEQ